MDLRLVTTAVVATAAGVALTGLVLPYARGRLLALPVDRSSHAAPTPTGGGLSIVLVVLTTLAFLAERELMGVRLAGAAGAGLLLVAGIGWADDHRDLAPLWRLVAQFIAGMLAVWALGGLGRVMIGGHSMELGLAGSALAVLGTVWLVNLYNFMDGVDGLAGVEGVFVSGAMAAMFWLSGENGAALLAASLAGACAGFLFWNWPPARIFPGDAGAYGVGFTLAVLALYGQSNGSVPLAASGILAAVFVVDATYTLLARLLGGARWYTAHREHAYQAPVAAGANHRRVVLAISLVNILLLLPLAMAVWLGILGPVTTVVGVAVTGWVVWFLVRRKYR